MSSVATPQESTSQAAKTSQDGRLLSRLGVAAVVVVALVALFWPQGDGSKKAPAGLLFDAEGRQVTLASRMAPVTLVHFWATWCPPCIDEVPSIQRLEKDLGNNHQFTLLMIAVRDDPELVKSFLGESSHRSLFDNEWKVAKRYETRKVPETHLVVNGEIIERFIGAANWDDPAIRARIQEALQSVQETTG